MDITLKKYESLVEAMGAADADAHVKTKGFSIVDEDGTEVKTVSTVIDKSAEVVAGMKNDIASIVKSELASFRATLPDVQIVKEYPKHNLGELCKAICDGSWRSKQTTFNSEINAADGGALTVPQLDTEVIQAVFDSPIFQLVNQVPVAQSQLQVTSIRYPLATGDTQTTQGSQKEERKLVYDSSTLTLETLYWLVPVSTQLMEDAPQFGQHVLQQSVAQIKRSIEDGIINGTTAGFTGIVGDAGTLTIARTGIGVAGTTAAQKRSDVANMFSRLWPYNVNMANVAWVMSPTVFPEIDAFRDLNGIQIGNTPVPSLYGIPIVFSAFCPQAGIQGDILLCDLSKYKLGMKSRGITTEQSAHLWFDYNLLAFRTEGRFAGIPPQRTLVQENGVQYSWFVELDEASGTDIDEPTSV